MSELENKHPKSHLAHLKHMTRINTLFGAPNPQSISLITYQLPNGRLQILRLGPQVNVCIDQKWLYLLKDPWFP